MALRRELLLVLVAAFLLLAPGRALAAPQWLAAEERDGVASSTPADVAADADGNAVAVWLSAGGTAAAAFRPRGGPWQAAVDLDPGNPLFVAPHVTVRSNGEFVAAWIADVGGGALALRSATRSTDGEWTAETIRDGCCDDVEALEGTADGSVTVVVREDGGPSSNTLGPGSDAWGARQPLPNAGYDRFAFAPDGSTAGVRLTGCGEVFDCLQASYRAPGANGAWSDPELVPGASADADISGYAVAARGSGYTVVWGAATRNTNLSRYDPPGAVASVDRAPGTAGTWGTPLTVADLPADAPGCFGGNCFDVAAGPGGRQVAVWQQAGAAGARMSASLRSGGPWGGVENVGAPGSATAEPHAAITSNGIPAVAWGSAAQGAAVAHGSHRTDGGWQTVDLGTPSRTTVLLGDIAVDGVGNAVTAWDAAPGGVFSAGFDGAGPRFTAFSLPSGGVVAPFSAAAADDWSQPTSIGWTFGDGTGAPGGSVTHTYGAAGTFTATATATDAVGNATTVSGTVAVNAEPTPPPNPCGTADKDKDGINDGCDTNDGSKRPVAFKTVNAKVVSGEVFVKLPPGAGSARASQAKPPKGFVRLTGAQTIPVGSTLDTAKGRVSLRSASDTRKHVQTAQFFRGRFLIRQVRKPRGKAKKRSTKLITELRLAGSSFSKACKAKASISAKRRSKKRVRRLFGDGKGSFRTRGRNAAATVRGTRWSVQDRCDGTLVTVQRGRVQVRDLVRRRTVTVRTGHTYLARRR